MLTLYHPFLTVLGYPINPSKSRGKRRILQEKVFEAEMFSSDLPEIERKICMERGYWSYA